MKKKILIIIVILCGGFYILRNMVLVPKTYKEISYSTLNKMIDNKKDFVLLIGSSECSHCAKFKKTLDRVIEEYKIKINYIDISKLTEEENAFINAHFPYQGTPTTVVVKEGVEYERQKCRIEGARTYDFTVERLKKAGIIKE